MGRIFHEYIRPAFCVMILLALLLGVAYPAFITLIATNIFPKQAGGSLLAYNGKTVGSELIGQNFREPRYFWGRLSATTPFPYNAEGSSGSNFGANNPDLKKAVSARAQALGSKDKIPVDLVTSSGSGLDPEISLEGAYLQIPRIARVRRLDEKTIRGLVDRLAETRQFHLLGEPRVNVLKLNLALDEKLPR